MTRFVALLALVAAPAGAACSWSWDCTGGTCRQVPVCSNSLEIPPIKPIEIAPIAPPTIKPISPPTLPPLGTRQCSPRYLCSSGICSWQTVCR